MPIRKKPTTVKRKKLGRELGRIRISDFSVPGLI